MKTAGIAIVTRLASEFCRDAKEGGLASAVELAGTALALSVALPLMTAVLDMLIQAYERQLDRLFRNDALDIATDIDVLETMMAGDGLSSKGQMPMQ